MKKNVGKLFVFTSLVLTTLFSCKGNDKGTEGNYVIYKEDENGYTVSTGQKIDIRFYNNDIPYVDVNTYLSYFDEGGYSISNNGNIFTFVNNRWKNDSHNYSCNATLDVNSGVFTYDDYAVFVNTDWSACNPIDLNSSLAELSTGSYSYRPFKVEEMEYIPGGKSVVNLKSTYNIEPHADNNKLFLPLYTAKVLFQPENSRFNTGTGTFFNGKGLYIEGDVGDEESSYDKIIKKSLFTPSSTYLEYCFNELCLELDLIFGMQGTTRTSRKTGKDISYNFGLNNGDSLAKKTLASYKSQFIKSPTECDKATYKIYHDLLDDGGHTALVRNSYYSTYQILPDESVGDDYLWTSQSHYNLINVYSRIEHSTYINKVGSYDNTALLVLNGFDDLYYDFNAITDCCADLNNSTNTSVKHLIIDLSINGGGYVFLQYMLTHFLTRGQYKSYVYNATNGSKGYVKLSPNIQIDPNPSYNFNENTLKEGISVDIICSNASFSAANATAVLTQKYGTNVKFEGENSGGGACTVMGSMVSPLGQYAQWSSPNRICLDSNYQHDDDGIDTNGLRTDCKWSSHTKSDLSNFSNYDNIASKL